MNGKWKMTAENNSSQLVNYNMITSGNWVMTENFKPYIKDRPSAPWTDFAITNKSKSSKTSKTIKTILSKRNKHNSNKKTVRKLE